MFTFTLTAQEGHARVGQFSTPHGTFTTPQFMPVGTHGAVKSVSPADLQAVGSEVVLGNTYHLYLRPGEQVIQQLGGLHSFTGWSHPMLTDSGGFQVFSLGEKSASGGQRPAMRKISEDGIIFKSHLDGSSHLFTPERSIQIQSALGADIIMAFDQPVYGLSDEHSAKEAMERSMRWLVRSKAAWINPNQALFGIVQGGIYETLHTQSAQFVAGQDLPGNAIGGLSVGEGKAEMWAATANICQILPKHKPVYFMGLGEPADLMQAVSCGVDMFDCVSPSRLARHGNIWQVEGDDARAAFQAGDLDALLKTGKLEFKRVNIHNAKFRISPLHLPMIVPELPSLPLATLHHYLKENEMLGYRILTSYNIWFLHQVVRLLRVAIARGKLGELMQILKEGGRMGV